MSVKIMGMVWDLGIPQNWKLVLLAYADHASHDGSSIYPSVGLIAQKTGYSERSVQVITRDLEEHGYLTDDGHGPKGTNKWRIPIYGGKISKDSRGADSAPVQSTTLRGAEIDIEGCRKDLIGVKPTAPEPSLTVIKPSLTAAEIFTTYENNIGLLTPILADKIGDAIDTYPHQWILDAIQETVTHGVRNWVYVEKVLKTWKSKGRSGSIPLDKMSAVDQELLRRGIRPITEVLNDMGLNDISEEEQKKRYLEQKRKELQND